MKVSVSRFSHDPKDKSFYTEMSDIAERGWHLSQGITLVSDLGNEVHFAFISVDRSQDEDNEVLAWNFKPNRESVEANPRLDGYSLTIFND